MAAGAELSCERTMEPRRLFLATFCFAWGGLLLLAGAPYAPISLCCLGSGFVSVLFLIGQVHLGRSIVQDLGSPRRRCAASVFVASNAISAFSFGYSAWIGSLVPQVFPVSYWWRIDWRVILVYGLYLFIPTLYAPILVGNGILFWLASRERTEVARPYLVAAGVALIGVAAAALAVQISWTPEQWQFFQLSIIVLPALTGPAYALAALGLWRERRFSLGRFPSLDASS